MINNPHDIPPVNFFVGRDTERKHIQDFLFNPKKPILLVYGLRGVGKTSLVSFVVNEYKDNFSSIIWIDRSNALELFEGLHNVPVNLEKNKIYPRKNEETNLLIDSAKETLLNPSSAPPFY